MRRFLPSSSVSWQQHWKVRLPATVLASGSFTPLLLIALALLIFVLLANALWSVVFFRWRDLRISFLAFIPYFILVAALVGLLVPTYWFGAVLFMCYCIYLLYATWWGYRLWLLNRQRT